MREEESMKIAIEEAKNAYDNEGKVGAVIVEDNKIIAKAGSDNRTRLHAEHNALVKSGWLDNPRERPNSSIFLTYSPCLRRIKGIGASCCDQTIKAGIKKVVYGAVDPNFGKEETENYLRKHGIEVKQIENPETISECKKIFEESNQE